MTEWRPISVTIPIGDTDLDTSGVFSAYTNGQRWNGFEVPYFTEEEGKRVSAWTEAMRVRLPGDEVTTVRWDDTERAFILLESHYSQSETDDGMSEDVIRGRYVEELNLTLFGIGASEWTWESVEDTAQAMKT